MRSAPDDRTARTVIRDEALRLFAERGPDAVSVRQIAAAAGVSPGLVSHHFGSKDGLRDAVDAHVLAMFGAMLGELTTADLYDPDAAGSLAEAVVRHLPPDSPVSGYLRRLPPRAAAALASPARPDGAPRPLSRITSGSGPTAVSHLAAPVRAHRRIIA
jgi:AcrR family transcriptional regulator